MRAQSFDVLAASVMKGHLEAFDNWTFIHEIVGNDLNSLALSLASQKGLLFLPWPRSNKMEPYI